jgi:hypothetical protein
MSTYLPGITGYIPQIQPFTPDYNFLGQALQARQGKYDKAYEQISNVYGSLLNSPLTRDENIKGREEFFKAIDNDIKRLSGLDLSLQQNVDYAMDIFAPFYENKDIVNDMVFTKHALNQKQRGELMRYCLDPKECGGQWWEGGDRYINYKLQEFKNATREQALNFKPVNYIAKQDVIGMAMADAKANGFEVKYDQVQGGYIVTTKNGDKMISSLTEYFKAKFGGDPKVMEYYKANAYNMRNDFIYAKAQELGSAEAANKLYIETAYTEAMNRLSKNKNKNDVNKEIVDAKLEASKKTLQTYKPLPSDASLVEKVQALEQDAQVLNSNSKLIENAENVVQKLNMNVSNMSAYNEYIDDLMAYVTLDNEVGKAAASYAELNQSTTFKPDPYSLASFKHKLDVQKMLLGKQVDFDYWVKKEAIKAEHENKINEEVKNRLSTLTPMESQGGVATDILSNTYSFDNNQLKSLQILQDASRSKESYVKTAIQSLNDAVGMNQVTSQVAAATYKQIFDGTGIDANKILAGDQSEINKLSLNPNLTNIYNKLIKAINPDEPAGGFGMKEGWSENFWNSTSADRYTINKKTELYKYHRDFNIAQSNTATKYTKAQLESDKNNSALNMLSLIEKEMNTGTLRDAFFLTTDKKQKVISQYAYNTGISIKDSEKLFNKVETEWRTNYAVHSKAWDQINPTGPGGANAKTAGALRANFDAAAPKNDQKNYSSNLYAKELFNNYLENPNQAIVRFGGLEEDYKEGNDPQASQLAQRVISDFTSNEYKTTNTKRPKGSFIYSSIASHDPNYFGFTIQLDPAYAETMKGKAKDQGLTWDDRWAEGISVFIPKDAANNSLYRQSQYNDIDFVLDTKGVYSINDFPDAGKIEIRKKGPEQYEINGYVSNIDPQTGKQTNISAADLVRSSMGTNTITGLTVGPLINTLIPGLAQVQSQNRKIKDQLRKQQ